LPLQHGVANASVNDRPGRRPGDGLIAKIKSARGLIRGWQSRTGGHNSTRHAAPLRKVAPPRGKGDFDFRRLYFQ